MHTVLQKQKQLMFHFVSLVVKKCNKIKGLGKMKNKNSNMNVSLVSLAASKSREERKREPSTTRATGPPESAP